MFRRPNCGNGTTITLGALQHQPEPSPELQAEHGGNGEGPPRCAHHGDQVRREVGQDQEHITKLVNSSMRHILVSSRVFVVRVIVVIFLLC